MADSTSLGKAGWLGHGAPPAPPGRAARVPAAVEELERRALAALPASVAGYLAGGAGGEETVRANREAFRRWRIVPRVLRDVSQRRLGVELFGQTLAAPVVLGPVALQGLMHGEGELASARAAAALGLPFVLSTVATRSLEEVAEAVGEGGLRWFQYYWPAKPELAASFVRRAEKAGYRALVITVDTPVLGWRERELDGDSPLGGAGLANFSSDPIYRADLAEAPERDPVAALRARAAQFPNPKTTWSDLAPLRRQTRLPLLLKGIQHPDDAVQAVSAGVDGIIVSNHGGRQLDGAIGALDALPAIVQAVRGRIPVLFDSGVRRGADVIKALSLGASAVLLGRLYTWGLALGGEAGVRTAVSNLIADFDVSLAIAGYTRPAELGPHVLRRIE